jgi:hypothetical protein
MSKAIKPSDLGAAIAEELTVYHEDVTESVNAASERAVKKLVKLTKASAPVGARGDFKKSIASKLLKKSNRGNTFVWYVKAPNHRLTHLLVHGHALVNGARTDGDPFLHKALDEVLPEYVEDIEEAMTE